MNINFRSIIIALFLTTLFIACKNDPSVLEKGTGKKISAGDYVFFTITVKADSTVLEERTSEEMMPVIKIPVDFSQLSNFIEKSITTTIAKASVGDSLLITIPVDSIGRDNPMLADKKMLYYYLRIKDAKDSIAYKAFIDKKMVEMQAEANKRMSVDVKKIEDIVKKDIADYKANKLTLQTTKSGLKYIIHEQGTGKKANPGQTVTVDYYGSLLDGTNFDKSYGRQTPFQFAVGKGNVIPGWDEAFLLFPEGTKATLFIPGHLGYGEQGAGETIPPNADLVFYVELNTIN
jgi:FKBP-type peptidyl-prolyl cis-trans isomerase FkpA